MKAKILSETENPLLKRKEVVFQVEHDQTGGTPTRLEVRQAISNILKKEADLVFIKKMETKTGTHIALGVANIYDSSAHARLIEPEYIVKRHTPSEKQEKGEEKHD